MFNKCEQRCAKLFLLVIEWFAIGSSTTGLIVQILYYSLPSIHQEPKFLNYSLSDWNLQQLHVYVQ